MSQTAAGELQEILWPDCTTAPTVALPLPYLRGAVHRRQLTASKRSAGDTLPDLASFWLSQGAVGSIAAGRDPALELTNEDCTLSRTFRC